jgi:hypothetical protein
MKAKLTTHTEDEDPDHTQDWVRHRDKYKDERRKSP